MRVKRSLGMRLLPWLVTILIFTWIFHRVPLGDLLTALGQVRLLPYLALMVPYSVCYCLVDAWVLCRVINWFHTRVAYHRILPVRAAAYILALLNPSLGQGAVAFALHRREGVPFLELTGSILFLTVLEFCQLALYAALGIFGWHPHLAAAFAPLYVVLGVVLGLGLLYVHRGRDPLAPVRTRVGCWRQGEVMPPGQPERPRFSLFHTFQQARLRHYLLTLLYKAPNFLLAVVVHYLALQQFGVHVPLVRLLAFLPIVFLVASLPITVAHLGTSQAAWLYFFAPYGPESQLLAYSLVAHLTFMLLNGLIGLCFLRQALRGIEQFPSP
jgi:hypothetical protein